MVKRPGTKKDKTFEEHLHYLDGIVRLKLWFLCHWLRHHPQESLSYALRWRIDLFRKTVFWRGQGLPTREDYDVPDWLSIEEQLRELYAAAPSAEPSAFEREAFAVVWGAVETNATHDYERSLADRDLKCGSLHYDPPTAENPGLVHLHISNAVRPRSIFDDRAYLPECFHCLMDDAESEHGADSLGTGSWLNSYPPWLALFPCEYVDHMGPEEDNVWCGLGHWGQFVNARGTLNEKRARILRETGRLPFPLRYSWCSFAAMRAHLDALALSS
jgi:hypothetical protein